jgi:hypothetical protein
MQSWWRTQFLIWAQLQWDTLLNTSFLLALLMKTLMLFTRSHFMIINLVYGVMQILEKLHITHEIFMYETVNWSGEYLQALLWKINFRRQILHISLAGQSMSTCSKNLNACSRESLQWMKSQQKIMIIIFPGSEYMWFLSLESLKQKVYATEALHIKI